MVIKTVRLDEDSERMLQRLANEMGLSASAVLKQGLFALRQQRRQGNRSAYELYRELDLGPGGYALAPSTESRRGVEEVLNPRPTAFAAGER
jgi:hypothetical protein